MLDDKELEKHIDEKKDILLLDVRSAVDFNGEQGHIKQAQLLPLEELKQRANALNTIKKSPLLAFSAQTNAPVRQQRDERT